MLDALPMAQRVAPLAVVHAAAVRGHLAPARALARLPGALEIAAVLGRQPALACNLMRFMMSTCCITVSCLDHSYCLKVKQKRCTQVGELAER